MLKVEGLIRDIIELGEKYSELERDAFSTATIRKILERFPERMVAKFNRLKGDGKAKPCEKAPKHGQTALWHH